MHAPPHASNRTSIDSTGAATSSSASLYIYIGAGGGALLLVALLAVLYHFYCRASNDADKDDNRQFLHTNAMHANRLHGDHDVEMSAPSPSTREAEARRREQELLYELEKAKKGQQAAAAALEQSQERQRRDAEERALEEELAMQQQQQELQDGGDVAVDYADAYGGAEGDEDDRPLGRGAAYPSSGGRRASKRASRADKRASSKPRAPEPKPQPPTAKYAFESPQPHAPLRQTSASPAPGNPAERRAYPEARSAAAATPESFMPYAPTLNPLVARRESMKMVTTRESRRVSVAHPPPPPGHSSPGPMVDHAGAQKHYNHQLDAPDAFGRLSLSSPGSRPSSSSRLSASQPSPSLQQGARLSFAPPAVSLPSMQSLSPYGRVSEGGDELKQAPARAASAGGARGHWDPARGSISSPIGDNHAPGPHVHPDSAAAWECFYDDSGLEEVQYWYNSVTHATVYEMPEAVRAAGGNRSAEKMVKRLTRKR